MELEEIKIGDTLRYKDASFDIIFKVIKISSDDLHIMEGKVLVSCNSEDYKNFFMPGHSIAFRAIDMVELTRF